MPDTGLDRIFPFLMNDVSRLLRKDFDQRARSLGLTRSQWRVLAHLGRQEGINQAGLAEVLEIESITLGRHIHRLEEAGWVERRRKPPDRRAWHLHLTTQAHTVFERMRVLIDQTEEAAFAGIPADQRERLLDTLRAVKINLADKGRAGAAGGGGDDGG